VVAEEADHRARAELDVFRPGRRARRLRGAQRGLGRCAPGPVLCDITPPEADTLMTLAPWRIW
jgi:hypothetical protein